MKEQTIPLCYKCLNKMVQLDLFDKEAMDIVGCKELSKKAWDEGYVLDEKLGILIQRNCPLDKPLNE